MRYHLYKSSRLYEGRPYCGRSSGGVPAQAATLEAACEWFRCLTATNPGVGWIIWDTETNEDVRPLTGKES
jgi:hypothetical protein